MILEGLGKRAIIGGTILDGDWGQVLADDNKRGHFRLEYPQADRPVFADGKSKYPVLDLSEAGMRFQCAPGVILAAGTVIAGRIIFQDGGFCDVEGRVLRMMSGDQCVMLLTRGVPLPRMMTEHRHILKKYKT